MDSPEDTWVQCLLPVFLSFDRKQEEVLDERRPFHHWYATFLWNGKRLMASKSCVPAQLSAR